MRIRRLWIVLFFLAILPLSIQAIVKPKMEDVASKLSCYCGTCPHLTVTKCGCSTAEQIKVDVQKMIDSGMSGDQIIQSYIAKYGQTVLAAPPKSGFNLTAWIIPFLAFAVGGVALVTFLKRQKNQEQKTEPVESPVTPEEAHYREILQEELQERK